MATIDKDRLAELTAQLPETRDAVFDLCRPLVRALAARFLGRGEPMDDLVQVASMGMLKAIDRFDSSRGDSLLSYATPVIVGDLRHHFRDSVRLMKIPRSVLAARRRVDACVEDLTQLNGRSPTVPEIVAATGLETEEVLEAVATVTAAVPVPIDELGASVADDAVTDLGEYAGVDDFHSMHLAELDPRGRRVVFLRYFRGYSQAEIAEEVGLSQGQVSRVLQASLDQIRESVTEPQ